MGEITMRLGRVRPRSVIGENKALMAGSGAGECDRLNTDVRI